MRNKMLLLLSFFAVLFCSMPAAAQDSGSARGNLSGVVYDSSKAIVPDAEVKVTGPIGSLTMNTGDQGQFLFQTLIPGFYTVRVQKAGFKIANFARVEVLINKTTSVEAVLEAGEVTQVLEVSAASVTVDTSSSSIGEDISDSFFQNIPVQRGVSSLFYLSPGATDGIGTGSNNPSISGSTGLENAYVADGVSINDPAFGGLGVWARSYGALGSGINQSFVKEVQIKTGGFEPQYGHATGGIVQIVTKSGGTKMFGEVAGYFKPWAGQAQPANADDFGLSTLFGRRLGTSNFEGSAELGGYVPIKGLKHHLFFFGNIDPTFTRQYVAPAAGTNLFSIYNGEVDRRTNSYDYAAKLTFKINDRHTLESSIFGDPSHTNHVPWSTLNATDTSVNSKWDFGTRNWAVRYDGTIGSSWLVDGAFTWSWNHFTETPAADVTQIADSTLLGGKGVFNAQGFGFLEPYDSNTRSLQFDTSKTFHMLGQHTISVGYTWQFPVYDDITLYSGGKYTIPSTNATGGSPGFKAGSTAPGSEANAALTLQTIGSVTAAANCSLCPYMADPSNPGAPQQVLLVQSRGRFDSGITKSSGKYHAGYVNDAWEFSKYATLNVGLRWEQQRLIGNQLEKTFNDSWSPRVGFIVDPTGNRKTKFYANFGRYSFILPLDAAIRSLSSEDDVLGAYWAPASTTTGCPAGTPAGASCVVTNADGTPNYSQFFQPDAAHLLNNATGGVNAGFRVGQSGGEAFQPGIKMEYTDEFVVGAEHQFRGGITVSARYIDRRLKRVIEDEGGISVEQFDALANNGGGLNYFIGNPNAQSDIFVNPNEQTFGAVNNATIPCAADSSGSAGAFNCALETAIASPSAANATALEALGFPSACVDSANTPTKYVATNVGTTFGKILGSACFPALNGGLNADPNSLFGGEFQKDGKPDTYKNPKREYQAIELEVNKGFSHNWAMVANWRIARLQGNYEGAFRNDNNQADPGISSLFDLTEGAFGLIGQQQGIGVLNTDRKNVVNTYVTYVLDHSFAKNMVFGAGVRLQSGVPLTTLVAQEAYQNAGEVPINGRGDLGRAPFVGTVDAHLEYPWKINERLSLKFGFDAFNIANVRRQTLSNQNDDQGFGIPNPDFQKPFATTGLNNYFFTQPFSSRFSIRLVF